MVALDDGRLFRAQRTLRHLNVSVDRNAEFLGEPSKVRFSLWRVMPVAQVSNLRAKLFNLEIG
jgi:hypothetical protein